MICCHKLIHLKKNKAQGQAFTSSFIILLRFYLELVDGCSDNILETVRRSYYSQITVYSKNTAQK